MCGISGLILKEPVRIQRELQSMHDELVHRGPDGNGWAALSPAGVLQGTQEICTEPVSVAFAHRRLAILDLTETGAQPMMDNEGRYCITYNGEIYNFVELRRELESEGSSFRSTSDTEVLLQAYIRWGPEMLQKLIGMFAFAIWDRAEKKVFIARDFFGIKPLYFCQWKDGLAFSSEIKALLKLPDIGRKADPGRLYDYLRFGLTDHGGDTLFQSVKQLPPGCAMTVDFHQPADFEIARYFNTKVDAQLDISFQEAAAEIRELFLHSVDIHLRSDVPVGAALSGGVDSSTLVMAIRHLYPDQEIHAFSFVDGKSEFSEEQWIDIVADAANVISHKVVPTPEGLVEDFEQLVYFEDEPSGNIGIYPQHLVSRLARDKGIKVLLSGEGGDELFAGYTFFGAMRLASLLSQGKLLEALKFGRNIQQLPGRYNVWLESSQYFMSASTQERVRRFLGKDLMPNWLDRQWFMKRMPGPGVHTPEGGANTVLRGLHMALTETTIPHLLHYQDRASMSSSVESRVPFLTPQLVQFAHSLPESFFFGADGFGKAVFMEAMKDIVPKEIFSRRDKLGFDMSTKEWVKPLVPMLDQVFSGSVGQVPVFDHNVIGRYWEQVKRGERSLDRFVWRWANLIIWANRFNVEFA